jgi:hypothetical protein
MMPPDNIPPQHPPNIPPTPLEAEVADAPPATGEAAGEATGAPTVADAAAHQSRTELLLWMHHTYIAMLHQRCRLESQRRVGSNPHAFTSA